MGAANSKVEDEKALQLCRERNKFVRKALDGRCALADSHVAYIQSLRKVGAALRKFVQPEGAAEVSPFTSIIDTPETLGSFQRSRSHLSFASPSFSIPVDAQPNFSPSPSTQSSNRFEAKRMLFRGFSSTKVEEQPPEVVTATLRASSSEEVEQSDDPWDYFGASNDFPLNQTDEGLSEKGSSNASEDSEKGEDDFGDSPPLDRLVRNFKNLNSSNDHDARNQNIVSETESMNGEDTNSPFLSPLRRTPSDITSSARKRTPVKDDQSFPKEFSMDFISSLREIEKLFIKASETGKEVPRMLEANKLHFRPILQKKESGIGASNLVKSCFSCGNDPIPLHEEPVQDSGKYLTWHRTASSSSRNPLEINDEQDDSSSNLFDNTYMISGSHASTLDRLFAWERKLYDEVKASQAVRRDFDAKCKLLRQLESKEVPQDKIYKIRADVKDLHSRIRIAIQRIDSISKRIEDLRDKELQPQLVELIKGLSRMWKGMYECHKIQFNIISTAYDSSSKLNVQSDAHRQITISVENELKSLSSCFMTWINNQKFYLKAINDWLLKCVLIPQKPTRKKKSKQNPEMTLRKNGPSIYSICGEWLDASEKLPAKDFEESIKGLVAEINHFLPLHEKNMARTASSLSRAEGSGDKEAADIWREEASEECISRFRSSLVAFLGKLNSFAESSVMMYAKLESIIEAKCNCEPQRLQ